MRPRVFSIGPGCPFLETFVTALFKGQVIPEFSEQSDSFKLAKFRIYVPTRPRGSRTGHRDQATELWITDPLARNLAVGRAR